MIGWDELRRRRLERMKEIGIISQDLLLPERDEIVTAWEDVVNKDAWDLTMAVYAAMIDRMDQNIGRILTKIHDMGEEENTLVLFLSDNGGCAGEANYTPDIPPGPVESYRSVDPPWANASNTPFRKYKVWDHEGGICTPFIAYWPRVIKQSGQLTGQVGHIIDIMATFVDISGADYPSVYNGQNVLPLEGKSLLPVFEGKQREGHEVLYWQIAPGKNHAIRQGDWKLVTVADDAPWELYNLKTDRTESHDLSRQYPEKVKKMEQSYQSWADKVGILDQLDK